MQCLCQQVFVQHQTKSSGSFDVAASQTQLARQGTVDVRADNFHVPYSVPAQVGLFVATSSPASLQMMTTKMTMLCRRRAKSCPQSSIASAGHYRVTKKMTKTTMLCRRGRTGISKSIYLTMSLLSF